MGLPQVPSDCTSEEVAAPLGKLVETAPRIASIGNYEVNLLEDLGNCMQIDVLKSERKNGLELTKESHISIMCKDDGKLKIDPLEQIGRLSVNVRQTTQTPTSRTVGFQIKASTTHADGYGGNQYSSTAFNVTGNATEASESQVRKRLWSPLKRILLADQFKGDPLDIGGGIYQSCSKASYENSNASHEYKKVHIGNNNHVHSMILSTTCLQEFKNSSCNDSTIKHIVSSHHHSHGEHAEPWSYKHFNSSPALTVKTRSQTAALSIPQKKLSSPPFPLSPLGKKSSKNENLEGCRNIDAMLEHENLTYNNVEQSLDRTCQGILSAKEMLNSNNMQQKSDLFTPDNMIDMKEDWTHPSSFPPKDSKLCGNVSRLPIRRSLVGSFEESLLSGRLLSGKVSQVGIILICSLYVLIY